MCWVTAVVGGCAELLVANVEVQTSPVEKNPSSPPRRVREVASLQSIPCSLVLI